MYVYIYIYIYKININNNITKSTNILEIDEINILLRGGGPRSAWGDFIDSFID